MDNFLNVMFYVLTLVGAFSIMFGVNLRKWYGWFQVVSGFLLGLLIGTHQNIMGGIITGAFFALLIALLGLVVWKRRQSYKSLSWRLLRHREDDQS